MLKYKMNVGATVARPQPCLKRLLDEPSENVPKSKEPCLAQNTPATGLPLCLRFRRPAPNCSRSQSPSKVGPYFLFERFEGEETDRAEHAQTKQQYTCQVLPLRCHQEKLAAYSRVGRHDNICSLLDVVIGQEHVHVFLPSHYGDMHAYVRNRKRLGEEEARRLFTQMLNAVMHCHRHGVVLRDLKLRRFVFTDKHRTHLALLGLNDCVLLHGNRDDCLTDKHGCPAYVSPEMLTSGNGSYSGCAADVWSLGVSLYTMLIGRYPFQDTQPAALFTKICHGVFCLPDWLSLQAKCLIGCMLRKSPTERLEASELLTHPWLISPCKPHHNMYKRHDSSAKTRHSKQEDGEQVVPTWLEQKH
ncbi:tribbles homolog 2-like [Brachionichthys hirsutus]|uniref:tribbles homolog 2-like n=1 Tax=Brachionichthys hirsutus TaxID=412623 RepID=UPI003604C729